MARPSKLDTDPSIQPTIVNAMLLGNYFDAACLAAGISEATGYNWRQRGRDEKARRQGNVKVGTEQWNREQKYVEFLEAVEKAEAEAERNAVAEIRSGKRRTAEGQLENVRDWQRLAWFLERRFPDKWGRRHSTADVTITHREAHELTNDELERIARTGR